MKRCTKCSEEKDLTSFARKRGSYASWCKKCHNLYYKKYFMNSESYSKHKTRVSVSRVKTKLSKYNLSQDAMQLGLQSSCQLCKIKQAVVMDHCHETGRFRGFLCTACNTGLGKLGDTVESLEKAIEYLKSERDRTV